MERSQTRASGVREGVKIATVPMVRRKKAEHLKRIGELADEMKELRLQLERNYDNETAAKRELAVEEYRIIKGKYESCIAAERILEREAKYGEQPRMIGRNKTTAKRNYARYLY